MSNDDDAINRLLDAARACVLLQRTQVLGLFEGGDTASDAVKSTLHDLFLYASDRAKAVLILVASGLDWDAEIVLRTFYEGVAKILYICDADESVRRSLVEEFLTALGETADRRTARKAAVLEEIIPADRGRERDVFRLLQDPRIVRDNLNLSKSERQRLEQKWSFSEIVETLSQRATGKQKIPEFRGLLHVYGMASHLTHADSKALDLMVDRATRAPAERRIIEEAHVARILTDITELGHICAVVLSRLLEVSPAFLEPLANAKKAVTDLAKPFSDSFYTSQEGFYREMCAPKEDSETLEGE
jgi:hypothetical protein